MACGMLRVFVYCSFHFNMEFISHIPSYIMHIRRYGFTIHFCRVRRPLLVSWLQTTVPEVVNCVRTCSSPSVECKLHKPCNLQLCERTVRMHNSYHAWETAFNMPQRFWNYCPVRGEISSHEAVYNNSIHMHSITICKKLKLQHVDLSVNSAACMRYDASK